jgi:hypothetical protein
MSISHYEFRSAPATILIFKSSSHLGVIVWDKNASLRRIRPDGPVRLDRAVRPPISCGKSASGPDTLRVIFSSSDNRLGMQVKAEAYLALVNFVTGKRVAVLVLPLIMLLLIQQELSCRGESLRRRTIAHAQSLI